MRFLLFFVIFILISCQPDSKTKLKEHLTGRWVNAFDDFYEIEFTTNGYFYNYQRGELNNFNSIFEENEDGEYIEHHYGDLKYQLAPRGDSIYYRIVGSKNKKEFYHGWFILNGNHLTKITYKTLPGIEKHIDEMVFYIKKGTESHFKKFPKTEKVIIPSGFQGNIHIAYNQKEGKPKALDKDGNKLLEVSKEGLLKTQFREDPQVLAAQAFEFYERDGLTGELKKMRSFQHGEYRRMARNIRKINGDSISIKYNPDSTAIFTFGFNQYSREILEKRFFKEKIEGNVVSFEIDTISKMLKLEEYFGTLKN